MIAGGRRLAGTVAVRGAKNAVLKHLVACLLAPGRHRISNVPGIIDVEIMRRVLAHVGADDLGARAAPWRSRCPTDLVPEAPIHLVRQMRASILVLGALLARCGEARVALPGGDDFGSRPIDMHIDGFEHMGARFELSHGVLLASAPGGLHGAEVYLEFPSVGATENLLLAGAMARGRTVIGNAAREPEIEDLAAFLVKMGARVTGAGTSTIEIEGVPGPGPGRPPGGARPPRGRHLPDGRGHHRRRGHRGGLRAAAPAHGVAQAGGGRLRGGDRGGAGHPARPRAPAGGGLRHPALSRASTPTCTRRWWRCSPWPPGPR